MKNFLISLLLLLNFFSFYSFAQERIESVKFDFTWIKPVEYELQEEKLQKLLSFENAQYNLQNSNLPFFYKEIHTSPSQQVVSVELLGADYIALEQWEQDLVQIDSIASAIKPLVIHSIVRKQHVSFLKLFPFRKNPATGQLEKLKYVELAFNYAKVPS